jgi:ABC-type phosphate/phosphonate transport system permease subunit
MSKLTNLEVKLSRNKHFFFSKNSEKLPLGGPLKISNPEVNNRINTVLAMATVALALAVLFALPVFYCCWEHFFSTSLIFNDNAFP